MSVARKSPGKSPDQLRLDRAQVEYHSCTFSLMTVKTSAGDRGVVYVRSASGNTYCVTDNGRCSCPDFQRRQGLSRCKHLVMVEDYFLTGNPPEPPAEPSQPATVSTPQLPITQCACCGELLSADEAVSTVKRRDGSVGGHVCRDSGACVTRRQGPAPTAPEPLAEAPAVRRARIIRDRELWD